MTNESFILLSDEEKNRKLKTVLKRATKDCLTEEELKIIMIHISINRQYTIRIYTEPLKFLTVLAALDTCESSTLLGSVIAGAFDVSMTMFVEENAAAVITKSSQGGNWIYYIHIYIPPSRTQRSHE